MKLTYFRSNPANFGDALNETMWQALLPPGFLDQDARKLFLGIGSIIEDDYPRTSLKLVAGSGFGGYAAAPKVNDGSWDFGWVRGPRTAFHLGIAPKFAIGDAAILLRHTSLPEPSAQVRAAFMPHYQSLVRGDWARACALAGIEFLDPGSPVTDLIARIRGARVVIAEAMHGAIVADALRTPWIAILPFDHRHREKWFDWAEAIGVQLEMNSLPPSTLREALAAWTGRHVLGRRSERMLSNRLLRPANALACERAASGLAHLAEQVQPMLSEDGAIRNATERMLEALYERVRAHSSARSSTLA